VNRVLQVLSQLRRGSMIGCESPSMLTTAREMTFHLFSNVTHATAARRPADYLPY
jgi:hypothetical protein